MIPNKTILDLGLGKSGTKSGLLKIIGDDDGTVPKNREAANFTNQYYVHAGSNLAKDFDDAWPSELCKINVNSTFKYDFVTESQISKLIKNINICKSSAVENFSSRLFKDSFEVLTLELTQLYNECLIQGYFPKDWSLGIVTPIPNVNVRNKEPKNWRPVSQIQLPGKLLEHTVNQISNW